MYRSTSGGVLDTRQLADIGMDSDPQPSMDPLRLQWSSLLTGCLFSDLEQLEVSSLCDGVVRFLQDLPGPVLPSSLQADMIHAVQGQ